VIQITLAGRNGVGRRAAPFDRQSPADEPAAPLRALVEAFDSLLIRIGPVRRIRGNFRCSNAAAAPICGQQFGQMHS
jgi:hypothetical protein